MTTGRWGVLDRYYHEGEKITPGKKIIHRFLPITLILI